MGKSWSEIVEKVTRDVPTTVQSNWAVWCPVQPGMNILIHFTVPFYKGEFL